MNKPDLIGLEVMTPDGRGEILALYPNRVKVSIHTIEYGQKMVGTPGGSAMHFMYFYEEVEIIKGRYCFDDKETKSRFPTNYFVPNI